LPNGYCKLHFTSEPTHIRNMVGTLMDFVDGLSPETQARNDLKLIFSELMYNAVVHGNKGDPTKYVEVLINITDSRIAVTIEDEGVGYDYQNAIKYALSENALLDEGGRGIVIVQALTDKLSFNETGNIIRFEKRFK